jgi:MFS family permease
MKGARLGFTIAGLIILGLGTGTVVVPILVDMTTAIREKLGPQVAQEANNKASGLFTMATAFGSILGPILGATLYEAIYVHTTCDIFAASSLLMAIIFFTMNIWPGYLLTPPLQAIENEDKKT